MLGLGVGYEIQAQWVDRNYGSPLATMRDYLERMDAPQPMLQVPDVAYARIIAANGPKMLALAGEIADGALPNVVTPEWTANARQVLGPDKRQMHCHADRVLRVRLLEDPAVRRGCAPRRPADLSQRTHK